MNEDRSYVVDEAGFDTPEASGIGGEVPAAGWEGYSPEVLDRLEE